MSTFKMLNLQVIFTLLFLIAYSWTAELSDQVIDGHNDLPYNLYKKLRNNLDTFNFNTDLTEDAEWGSKVCSSCFTDIPRLKKGNVGAQFWVAYVDCKVQYRDAFAKTVEQIDVIKRLVKKYEDKLQFASSASEIKTAITGGKIGSLIGVEGGHSMDSRLSVLRTFYDLGVRYMTLTHSCNTPWADTSAVDDSNPIHNLTEFGKTIVQEMNRLGMMVDLAHVSHNVMRDALAVTRAPVIFSHSSAYAVTKHHRNVPDDVLELVKKNKGVVMVNFFSPFVNAKPDKATINDVVGGLDFQLLPLRLRADKQKL